MFKYPRGQKQIIRKRYIRHKATLINELRFYNESKKELLEIEEDIINSSFKGESGMPKSTDIHSVTENKAIELYERKKELEKIIKAIDILKNSLEKDKHKYFFKLRYEEGRTYSYISCVTGDWVSMLEKIENDIAMELGILLGWIKI